MRSTQQKIFRVKIHFVSEEFNIDPLTGEISSAVELDRETKSIYILLVNVTGSQKRNESRLRRADGLAATVTVGSVEDISLNG